MIGLDTNVLVRILTVDDPAQAARARRLVESNQAADGDPPGMFVAPIVICELAWVLASHYGQSRGEVARALRGLLDSRGLEIGDRDAIRCALERFEAGPGGFSDYYVGESSRRAGCEAVATFDKRLLKSPGFRPV